MLTGKRRYRLQKFTQKLVLQVEEKYTYDRDSGLLDGRIGDIRSAVRWRDATINDLLLEGIA